MNISFFIPLLISLVPMFGWGIVGVLAAKLSRKVGGLNGGFLIQAGGLLLTFLVWPVFFSIPRDINWLAFIFLGIVGALTYALFCHSLKVGKVPIIIPLASSWAIITSTLGIVILKESVSFLKILSILIIIGGVMILTVNWSGIKKTNNVSIFSSGIFTALLVALGWGVSYFLLGPVSKQMGWFFTTLGNRVFMVLFLLLFFLRQSTKEKLMVLDIPWKILLPAALLDVIAFTSYNLAVSHYEVSYVSAISSASSLVSVVLASVFLKEKTNFIQKIGIVFVIIGIIGLQI